MYEYIIFRGPDIKDIRVSQLSKPPPMFDPAIVQVFFLTFVWKYFQVNSFSLICSILPRVELFPILIQESRWCQALTSLVFRMDPSLDHLLDKLVTMLNWQIASENNFLGLLRLKKKVIREIHNYNWQDLILSQLTNIFNFSFLMMRIWNLLKEALTTNHQVLLSCQVHRFLNL